jgi:hypothetical protein
VQRPGWFGKGGWVRYPKAGDVLQLNDLLEMMFTKPESHSGEREFRIALGGPIAESVIERIPLVLGDLRDICTLTVRLARADPVGV